MNQAFKIGNIFGVACILSLLAEYYCGMHETSYIVASGVFAFFLKIIASFIAILFTKKKELGGVIDFRQALKAGLSVSFIIAALYGLFMLLFVQYIEPSYPERIAAEAEKVWRVNGESESIIKTRVEALRANGSAPAQGWGAFSTSLVLGTIVSLIFAYFMKSKTIMPPPPSNEGISRE